MEQVSQRGAWSLLGGERDNGRPNALMDAAIQLPLLLQGHPEALDGCDVHRRRGAGQGRAGGMAQRHAGSDAALGAVPRGDFFIADSR